MKTLDTLVDDIYGLFGGGVVEGDLDALAEEFAKDLAGVVKARLMEQRDRKPTLRMSNIGKADRQLFYEIKGTHDKDSLTNQTLLKFMYGDVIESLLLFLAKVAGHEVTGEQDEIIVDGIVGHRDAVIDGVVVDVKSAAPFSFKKFKEGTLWDDDPFGYAAQISGYIADENYDGDAGAFLAMDKVSGALAVLKIPEDKKVDVPKRIAHLKGMLESDTLPPRCAEPKPEGKSGNMKLPVMCSYCPHKFECYSDANDGKGLRTFIYSNGPTYLTKVVRQPKVFEVHSQ